MRPYEAAPEKRLLLTCARLRVAPSAAASARGILSQAVDWDYLLRAAAENSVLPLLALQLPSLAPDGFSAPQFERLKAAARAAGIRSLQLSAELIRVTTALRAENILALPYKGPVVAVQAYGDLALREFEDLDIILPQRDMARANEVLHRLSYKPRYPWIFDASALVPGEYNYFDEGRRTMVELHTEKTLRHFPVEPDIDAMSKSAVPVGIGGHGVLTFCPEDTLVLLCVHGSKDFWERISWITDVSEFVQRNPSLDWSRVFARAGELRATRMVLLGLALASQFLDAPLPETARAKVDADPGVDMLVEQIAKRLLAKDVSPRTAVQSFRYRRRMVPGAIGSWRYGLRLATAPAEEDWMMVRLPRALAPLYLVLRPCRLFRKYGVSQQKP
ncbi:MAG TPA: nucleotidyltransferase family protein [Candidatus Aquilonibacter sp.]|nr:nucleotidyltransferase family protein [Candidatus Aquilonibacter sp.]